ncbi:hypothetical protein QN277_015683 [Acacia crassicarpa]|uniref:Uncharacterized protein n=1 Tax=Acacia crassicarpa TaxID=499986 RepID=A0AAE1JWD6_9FABA|nr:hypothetical protein QN277_015683 [Acacia crassicarpa]
MAKRVLASVLLFVLILTICASFSSARLFNGVNFPAPVSLVLPSAGRVPSSEMRLRSLALPRRARKYGPLVLNMLPKGSNVPNSGPSKGINGVNN